MMDIFIKTLDNKEFRTTDKQMPVPPVGTFITIEGRDGDYIEGYVDLVAIKLDAKLGKSVTEAKCNVYLRN